MSTVSKYKARLLRASAGGIDNRSDRVCLLSRECAAAAPVPPSPRQRRAPAVEPVNVCARIHRRVRLVHHGQGRPSLAEVMAQRTAARHRRRRGTGPRAVDAGHGPGVLRCRIQEPCGRQACLPDIRAGTLETCKVYISASRFPARGFAVHVHNALVFRGSVLHELHRLRRPPQSRTKYACYDAGGPSRSESESGSLAACQTYTVSNSEKLCIFLFLGLIKIF